MALKLSKTRPKKLFVVFTIIIFVGSSYEMKTPNDVQTVEKSLLLMLGMNSRPQVDRRRSHIPKAMMNLYEKQMNQEYSSTSLPLPGKLTWTANTVRSYTHQDSVIDDRFPSDDRFRLNFDLSNFPETETITSSELKLNIVPTSSDSTLARINVYDIVQPGVKGKTKPLLRLIDTVLVNPTKLSSISLDVLPIIHRWLSDSAANFGMLIDIKSSSGLKLRSSHVRLRRSIHDDDASWSVMQPLLFLYSADATIQKSSTSDIDWKNLERRKRNTDYSKNKKKVRGECYRHALWVDFEKVGWNDWIVAPPGYEAYFCAGECPSQLPDHLNTTNHAIVQSLVHTVHPNAIPKPCCVPTKLSSISMLYLDEHNKAVLKNYPEMAVEGCGCR